MKYKKILLFRLLAPLVIYSFVSEEFGLFATWCMIFWYASVGICHCHEDKKYCWCDKCLEEKGL